MLGYQAIGTSVKDDWAKAVTGDERLHALVAPVRTGLRPFPRNLPPVGKAGVSDALKVRPKTAELSAMRADLTPCAWV